MNTLLNMALFCFRMTSRHNIAYFLNDRKERSFSKWQSVGGQRIVSYNKRVRNFVKEDDALRRSVKN